MTSNANNLSKVELNNQFLIGKKLTSKLPNRSRSRPVANGNAPGKFLEDKQTKEMANNLGLTVGMESDFGQGDNRIISEPKLSKEDPQETRHLKELLLLHLDWIQQQQESIVAKDRLILRLKQEKEALKCRLERMDRRMSLLRQKNECSPTRSSVDNSTTVQKETVTSTSESTPGDQLSSNPSRGSKRKYSLEPQSLTKKLNAVDDLKPVQTVNIGTCTDVDMTPNTTPSKNKTSRTSRSQKLKDSPLKQSYLFSQQPPRKCRVQTHIKFDPEVKSDDKNDSEIHPQSHSTPIPEKRLKCVDSESEDEEIQIIDQSSRKRPTPFSITPLQTTSDTSVLRTGNMYYVPVEICLPPWEISPKKTKIDNVVVPTWKIKHVPTGYQLEGTENLTDEIYMKRHQKPEADEKRRKRWDAQMMREQKMMERLQQRGGTMVNGAGTSNVSMSKVAEGDFVSFLPHPDNAKYLEVCNEVPVAAFGYPIPNLPPSEFSLPWFDLSRHKTSHQQKPSRGRRKHCI